MTRQQQYLSWAIDHVKEVADRDKDVREKYLSYCRNLPALVRACGLCQAMAFVEERADPKGGPEKQAYAFIRQHAAKVLGYQPDDLLNQIRRAPLEQYLTMTRNLLSAWVYHKRVAEAKLETKGGM
ncbi:MAG: type III-B CRISPR module-associated protein Cmr5 [Armatimonadota bacterium]